MDFVVIQDGSGYRFATPWIGVTPYAAGKFTTYSLPAYAEQVLAGTGTVALNYASKNVTASRSEPDFRTDQRQDFPQMVSHKPVCFPVAVEIATTRARNTRSRQARPE